MKKQYSKDFACIENNISELNEIMNEYIYSDLLEAIYCINICINNRCALEAQLKLNLCLKTCKKSGTNSIKNYKEFKAFFNRIKKFVGISYADDPIIEDFGEIKFDYEGSIYNVLVGTGYNSVYAQLYFFESLAVITDKKDELRKILKYNSDVIDYFKSYNISDGKQLKRFVLPKAILFKRVKKFFEELDFSELFILNDIISSDEKYIEKEHFINYNNKIYPLYNTSILIDFFDKYYKTLDDDQKIEVADSGIFELLSKLTNLDQNEHPFVLFPIRLLDKELYRIPYEFLFRTTSGATIIAIDKDRFENEEDLNEELRKIQSLAEVNNLKLFEFIKRNSKGHHGITITNKSKIKFIIYDSHVNLTETRMILREKKENNILECSALDLVYMLLFMENIDDLEKFIDYNNQNDYEQIIGFGGDSNRFFTWKLMNYMIAKGAIKFGLVDVGINTSDEYVRDYFLKIINDYPWNCKNKYLFSTPFAWNIECQQKHKYKFENKINRTFFGYVKYLKNNSICIFAHNLYLYNLKEIEDYQEILNLIDDLNLRKISTCIDFFNELSEISGKSIEILFMPYNYAKNVGLNIEDFNRKYVYSDCYINSDSINIRYTINYKNLYNDIKDSSNRTIENEYIKELFLPLSDKYQDIYAKLVNFLNSTSNEKKEVEVVQIKLDYIYNNSYNKFLVDEYSFLLAKKRIAKVCFESDILPGEYFGKDANKIIRKMQKKLIENFESEIIKYNQLDLHCKLLEIYSNSIHIVNVHRKRYDSITNVTDEVLNDVQGRIIEQREQEKRNIRTIQYLIESNLFLNRDIKKTINSEELNRLLGFSHWLINLNDSADICFFTDLEAHIEIDHEYVVDYIIDFDDGDSDQYNKRVYSKNNYTIANDDEDMKYIEKIMNKFQEETEINLLNLFDVCNYFQLYFINHDFTQLSSNVYSVNKASTIDNIKELINSNTNDEKKYITTQEIEKILLFLSITPTKIKKCNGKEDFFIPINEREKRNERFDVKPLYLHNDDIFFSPISIKNIHDMWFNGMLNFMLPYEVGLSETVSVILEWKKRYENKMVCDIKEIFEKNEIKFVKINVELYKIDKKSGHPLDLGDYDVIAIDDVNRNMWIIESKVLNRVGSFFEMYIQQRNFFHNKKYDEKFQRRIDYMENNYKKILKSYGYIDTTNYKIMPYMVFNKVMFSRYKKINFPIISIMELDEIIKKERN